MSINPIARLALFTMVGDAGCVALEVDTLMFCYSFEPPLAFTIGATVALIFSIGLVVRSYFLTEERLLRSEVWRALRPDERPAGAPGRKLARAQLEELLLRFAKAASGVAGILYCSALVLSASAAASGL